MAVVVWNVQGAPKGGRIVFVRSRTIHIRISVHIVALSQSIQCVCTRIHVIQNALVTLQLRRLPVVGVVVGHAESSSSNSTAATGDG
jgi:hypothetical protein